jgi:hypothetical protein
LATRDKRLRRLVRAPVDRRRMLGAAQHKEKGEDRYDLREVNLSGSKLFLAVLADGHSGAQAADMVDEGGHSWG